MGAVGIKGPGEWFITEFVVRGAFGQGRGTPKPQPRMSATGVGKPAQAGHRVLCSLLGSGRIDARDGWAYYVLVGEIAVEIAT